MEHKAFDWSGLWTRVFVTVVAVSLGVTIYTVFRVRSEIVDRRYQFCLAENQSSRRQRILWEGVIEQSQRNNEDERAFVLVGEKKFPVVFERVNNEAVLEGFRKFVRDTYPITRCIRGQLSPESPTP